MPATITSIGGLNASISGDIGLVKFASKCDIDDKPGGHMVLKGEQGPGL